jgi:hypothetical protein
MNFRAPFFKKRKGLSMMEIAIELVMRGATKSFFKLTCEKFDLWLTLLV